MKTKKSKEPKTWKHPRLYLGDDGRIRIIYPSGWGTFVGSDEENPYIGNIDYACWTAAKWEQLEARPPSELSPDIFRPKLAEQSRYNMMDYLNEIVVQVEYIGEIK